MKYFISFGNLFLITMFFAVSSFGQEQSLVIVIRDSISRTPVENVNVQVGDDQFTISDTSGVAKISFPSGNHKVVVSHVGYREVKHLLSPGEDTVRLFLVPQNFVFKEITIGERYKRNNLITSGFHHLKSVELKQIPGFLGEKDVIRSLQYLPGVYNPSEANSGLFVRGGTSDQARIYLNGAPLFNPSHLYNFLSTFNPSIIESIDFYKAGIPAEFGNAGSAILDIRLRQPKDQKTHVNGSVGLLTSNLALHGPIGNKLSYLVSGRRTYADFFLKYIKPENLAIEDDGFHFYDLNAALFYNFSADWRLTMQGYQGRDFFNTVDIDDQLYGNTMAGIHLTGKPGKRTVLNFDGFYTRYQFFDLGEDDKGILENKQGGVNLKISTDMQKWGVVNYGISSEWTFLSPFQKEDLETGETLFTDSFKIKASWLNAAFLSYLGKAGRFSYEIGVRANHYQNIGPGKKVLYNQHQDYGFFAVEDTLHYQPFEPITTYMNIEPRLSFSYKISQAIKAYASYDHIHQYQFHFSRSDLIGPWTETTLADSYLKPIKTNQLAAGLSYKDNIEVQAELYFKSYSNILAYREEVGFYIDKPYEQFTRQGDGKAKGFDLQVKKQNTKINAWISYSLADVQYTIEGINAGRPYNPAHDIRHKLNLFGSYKFNQKYELTLGWTYHTGASVEFPDALIEFEGLPVVYYDQQHRYKYRKRPYHRADISFTIVPEKNKGRRWQSKWEFSVYNFYGRKNPLFYNYFDTNSHMYNPAIRDGLPVYSYNPTIFYLFYITPSVTYSFKF